jgi:hypothetical protein
MPGRAMFKRAGVFFALAATTFALAGCASADHTWRGEFDARLEGAAGTVEEALEEASPHMTAPDEFFKFVPPGETLFFKSELIEKLDPPPGCEAVQVKGKAAVYGAAELLGGAFKNLTPMLERRFPAILEEELALFEKREREAANCGTG